MLSTSLSRTRDGRSEKSSSRRGLLRGLRGATTDHRAMERPMLRIRRGNQTRPSQREVASSKWCTSQRMKAHLVISRRWSIRLSKPLSKEKMSKMPPLTTELKKLRKLVHMETTQSKRSKTQSKIKMHTMTRKNTQKRHPAMPNKTVTMKPVNS